MNGVSEGPGGLPTTAIDSTTTLLSIDEALLMGNKGQRKSRAE